MPPGDLSTGAAQLQKAWKKLYARWESTRLDWRDGVSQEFEERYLAVVDAQIIATLARMRSLAAAASAAKNDCDH